MSKGVELFKERLYTIDCDTIYIRERTDDIQGAACDIHKACKGWRVHSPSSRIIKYVDIKKTKTKLMSLLTNDMDMEVEDIVEIYRKRWEIKLLFK